MNTTNNIDIVRGIYAALAGQDFAALVNVADPDVVISQTDALPWGGEFHGRTGLQEFLAHLLHHVSSTVEVHSSFVSGSQVVVVGDTIGETRMTGTPFKARVVHIWSLRAGKVIRFEPHIDTSEMLRALGAG